MMLGNTPYVVARAKARRQKLADRARLRQLINQSVDQLTVAVADIGYREEIDLYAILDPARDVGGDLYDFFFIDDDYLQKAAKPTSGVFVEYGGSGGVAKRVNVKFTTGKYRITINIRNKQGGVAPTHIMADYKPI